MRMRSIVFSFAVIILVSVQAAKACTCVAVPQKEIFRSSAAVFDGKVTFISYVNEFPGPAEFPTTYRQALVAFEVIEYWKGKVGKSAELLAWNHDFACGGGYTFEIGQRYVVYARNGIGTEKDTLSGTGCNQRIEKNFVIERKLLGRGRKPK
jgi:hypothetical protein